MPIHRLLSVLGFRTLCASWRSFTAVAVMAAMAAMLFTAFSSASADLQESCARTYQELGFLDFYLPLAACPRHVADRIARIPGVAAVEGRCVARARIPVPAGASPAQERLVQGRIIGLPTDRHPRVNDVAVLEGRYLAAYRGEALMERRFALAHGYRVGDRVEVVRDRDRTTLRLVGLAASAEFIWISPSQRDPRPVARRVGVLFVSERDACMLAGNEGINEIHARVDADHDGIAVMHEAHKQARPYSTEPPVPRADQRSHAMLEHDRRALAGIAVVVPLLFLLVGTAVQAGACTQLVTRNRRQVGVLLALGMPPHHVAAPYRTLALLVGGGGGLLGALAGHGLGRLCTWYYASVLGLPFVVTGLHPATLVASVLAVAVASILATERVVRRFTATPPAELCHADFAPTLRLPPLEQWMPWLARLPLSTRLALRNLLRQRTRSALALGGLTLSVALILMSLAVFDSLDSSVAFFFEKVHRYDLYVSLARPTSPSYLPPVERWAGVLRVERCLYQPVLLTARGQTIDVGVLGVPPEGRLLQLHDQAHRPLDVAENGPLFLSAVLQRRLQVRPEDSVRVHIDLPGAKGPTLNTVVGPTLFEPVAINPRLPLRRLQDLAASAWQVPPNAVNVLLLRVDPSALDAIRSRLDHCRDVETVVDLSQAKEDVRSLLGVVNAFFAVMLAFAGLLAFTLLSGTITLNLLERTRELSIMEALGVDDTQVTRLVLVETLLLWAPAVLLGVPLGWATGSWLLNHYQSDVLQATLALSFRSALLATLASLTVSVLATGHGLSTSRRALQREATTD